MCGDDFAEEGVVRGCKCEAFAHLSCLASHAATAVAERGDWAPWSCCDVCHHRLKGPALLAMGRACWKLYAPLADDDERRCRALTVLGLALAANGRLLEALPVFREALQITPCVESRRWRGA